MSKSSVIIIALAIGLSGFATTAQAQQKRDQATCAKLVKSNPAYTVQGRCQQACAAAVRRCMNGEKV